MYKLVEFIFSYLLILVDKFFVVDLTDETLSFEKG